MIGRRRRRSPLTGWKQKIMIHQMVYWNQQNLYKRTMHKDHNRNNLQNTFLFSLIFDVMSSERMFVICFGIFFEKSWIMEKPSDHNEGLNFESILLFEVTYDYAIRQTKKTLLKAHWLLTLHHSLMTSFIQNESKTKIQIVLDNFWFGSNFAHVSGISKVGSSCVT